MYVLGRLGTVVINFHLKLSYFYESFLSDQLRRVIKFFHTDQERLKDDILL